MRQAGLEAGTATAGQPVARKAWVPVLGNRPALVLATPLLVLLVAFVLYPLVRLVSDSLTAGDGLANYVTVFRSGAGRRSMVVTLVASVIVTLVSVGIGGVIAWYLKRTTRRTLRAVLWLSVLVPFWMGTVVKSYAIILLIASNGALNRALELFGLGPVSLLYTPTAVVLGMIYTMVPYAVFSLYGVFLTIDDALVAAARSMGASRLRALRSVVLPLALPGVVASMALVFAITLGFYVTPVLLGGAQTPFMATYIQDYILTFFNYPIASAASVILLVTAVAVLATTFKLVGAKRLLRAMG